ncbi:MAG: hypothetical protein AB7T31_12805 [Gemmatimonadales bacterium]
MPVRRALVGVLALGLLGCGTRGPRPSANPFEESVGVPQIRLRVRNANFYDATITVLGDTAQRRLGVVGGNQTAVFTMPWEFSSGLRLQIDLLAGPSCTTEAIQVNPGDSIEFQIPPDLGSTGFCE